MESKDWEYLGDGVYAGFDGYGIWLHANSHDDPTDKIYLEPAVMIRLAEFKVNIALKLAAANKGGN